MAAVNVPGYRASSVSFVKKNSPVYFEIFEVLQENLRYLFFIANIAVIFSKQRLMTNMESTIQVYRGIAPDLYCLYNFRENRSWRYLLWKRK